MEYHLIFVAVMECVEYLEGIFGQEKSNLVDSRLYRVTLLTGPAQKSSKYGTGPTQQQKSN